MASEPKAVETISLITSPFVILARPDITAFAANDSRNGIVYERIKILNPQLRELFFILRLKYLFKYELECLVVLLGYGILGGKPEILLGSKRVLEAGMREGANGRILIEHGLQHAGALKIIHGLTKRSAILARKYQLCLALFRYAVFRCLVKRRHTHDARW